MKLQIIVCYSWLKWILCLVMWLVVLGFYLRFLSVVQIHLWVWLDRVIVPDHRLKSRRGSEDEDDDD
uniref:ATP synthase F0 subunit 8 n=1 Tax=Romanomermis culicivorax TaxID=13658 RepID=A0A915KBX6_ROMCU